MVGGFVYLPAPRDVDWYHKFLQTLQPTQAHPVIAGSFIVTGTKGIRLDIMPMSHLDPHWAFLGTPRDPKDPTKVIHWRFVQTVEIQPHQMILLAPNLLHAGKADTMVHPKEHPNDRVQGTFECLPTAKPTKRQSGRTPGGEPGYFQSLTRATDAPFCWKCRECLGLAPKIIRTMLRPTEP